MPKRPPMFGALLVVLAAWALPVGGALAQVAAPLRIGLIAPLSGGSADFGNSMRHGAELAVAEINTAGGYLGRPLALVVRDDQAKPELGRAAALDLVTQEKVAFTIGFCNTGVALKALDVFETHAHVLMVPCATGTQGDAPHAGRPKLRVSHGAGGRDEGPLPGA